MSAISTLPENSSTAKSGWVGTKREVMGRQTVVVLYVLFLIAVVVAVDVLFFKRLFWARLIANVGIVLVFAAFYLRFLNRP